jgi:uncharacterized membrane protein YGL010W
MKRSLDDWLALYAESHQHPLNQQLHTLCVPLIMFSLLGLLAEIPLPFSAYQTHLALPVVIASLVFYLRLSVRYSLLMLLISGVMLGIISIGQITRNSSLWPWMTGIFIIAWVGQFIGHRIERKKPSFFQDLQFLLIGPLWVIRKWETKGL